MKIVALAICLIVSLAFASSQCSNLAQITLRAAEGTNEILLSPTSYSYLLSYLERERDLLASLRENCSKDAEIKKELCSSVGNLLEARTRLIQYQKPHMEEMEWIYSMENHSVISEEYRNFCKS